VSDYNLYDPAQLKKFSSIVKEALNEDVSSGRVRDMTDEEMEEVVKKLKRDPNENVSGETKEFEESVQKLFEEWRKIIEKEKTTSEEERKN